MVTGHRRRAAAALSLLTATMIAACSSSGAAGSPGGTGAAGSPGGTSAGSCAAGSPPAYLASAKIVFVGVMLPGPTVSMAQGNVLTSPARVRVVRYLKGDGPRVVTVVTGVSKNGSGVAVSEDGIQALAGQRWQIYVTTGKMPYETSICSGSAPLGASS
jgi:hypothetical protein